MLCFAFPGHELGECAGNHGLPRGRGQLPHVWQAPLESTSQLLPSQSFESRQISSKGSESQTRPLTLSGALEDAKWSDPRPSTPDTRYSTDHQVNFRCVPRVPLSCASRRSAKPSAPGGLRLLVGNAPQCTAHVSTSSHNVFGGARDTRLPGDDECGTLKDEADGLTFLATRACNARLSTAAAEGPQTSLVGHLSQSSNSWTGGVTYTLCISRVGAVQNTLLFSMAYRQAPNARLAFRLAVRGCCTQQARSYVSFRPYCHAWPQSIPPSSSPELINLPSNVSSRFQRPLGEFYV